MSDVAYTYANNDEPVSFIVLSLQNSYALSM
uniref:Uncharacterized protein n=1 Tax=Arundo donax TaxID=35708 RepID=A0A0A9HJP9_ARUDO